MIAALIVLSVLFMVVAVYAVDESLNHRRERKRRIESDEFRHRIANSALRGCPAVKWHRPYPVPAGADAWYWRVMIDGEVHLFTDEARTEARRRANNLLPSVRAVLPEPVAKRDKPRPVGEIPTE